MNETPQLENENVLLTPFQEKDIDYFLYLVGQYKYNITTKTEAKWILELLAKHEWVVSIKKDGTKGGFVYLSHLSNLVEKSNIEWTFDAYRDQAIGDTGELGSQAGRLVIDWFFKSYNTALFTMHDVRSRAATIACKRLGFKILENSKTIIGEFVTMVHHGN